MSHEIFETNGFCIGDRHQSEPVYIEGDLMKPAKFINGEMRNRKKSINTSDSTIQDKGLRTLFRNIGGIFEAVKK